MLKWWHKLLMSALMERSQAQDELDREKWYEMLNLVHLKGLQGLKRLREVETTSWSAEHHSGVVRRTSSVAFLFRGHFISGQHLMILSRASHSSHSFLDLNEW